MAGYRLPPEVERQFAEAVEDFEANFIRGRTGRDAGGDVRATPHPACRRTTYR
jgi:hypothetical protein